MGKPYTIAISTVAFSQIEDLYFYIAEKRGEGSAQSFTSGIQKFCMSLGNFPHRGTLREHPAVPSLRVVGFKRRVSIAFTVDDVSRSVTILGVFYGGQDFEHYLASPSE